MQQMAKRRYGNEEKFALIIPQGGGEVKANHYWSAISSSAVG